MTTERATAGHLPGLQTHEVQWQTLPFIRAGDTLEVAVPILSDAQTVALANRVKAASRAYLKTLPVTQIVAVVDQAIARLLDPQDPYRQKMNRLLPWVTGYDDDMVRLGLSGFLKTFRQPQLQRFLVEDFGNPLLLDAFQPRA